MANPKDIIYCTFVPLDGQPGKCVCTRCGFISKSDKISDCSRHYRPCDVQSNDDIARHKAEREMNRKRAEAGAEKLGITWSDAKHYAQALAKWTKAGFPTRSDAEVIRIFEECCKPCKRFTHGRCNSCGCRVNTGPAVTNKIRMATESCPLGKWGINATFVYPYLKQAAEGDELLYSVRSVEKNYSGYADIWIVGDRPEWWNREDRFIHLPKVRGGARIDRANKLWAILHTREIPDEFVWMQDDIYFVKHLSYDFLATAWTRGRPMTEKRLAKWKPKGFGRQKKITFQTLLENGKPLHDYAAHVPRIYTKENLKLLFDKYDIRNNQYVDDLLYCNEFHDAENPPKFIGNLMYRASGHPTDQTVKNMVSNATLHNHLSGSYRGAIERNLQNMFTEPSQWENLTIIKRKDIDGKASNTVVPIDKTHPKIAVCCATYGRPNIISIMVGCFARQEYPSDKCELIILDDGGQLTPGTYSFNGKTVLVHSQTERFATLGEKRNALRNLVSEDVDAITQWDDDDVFLPWALEAMADRLRHEGIALGSWMHWQNENGDIELIRKVSHTMSAFRLDTFDALSGYPECNRGEDTAFMAWCVSKGGHGKFPKEYNTIDKYHPYLLVRRFLPNTYHANLKEFADNKNYQDAIKQPGENVVLEAAALPDDIQQWYNRLVISGQAGMKGNELEPCRLQLNGTNTPRFAVVAPALGIEAERVEIFRKQAANAGVSHDDIYVDNSPLHGTLNLARARNRLLRQAIDDGRCDIIVQTDIDCVFTAQTLKSVAQTLTNADLCNVTPRYVDSLPDDIDAGYQTANKRFAAANGGFNAMQPRGWRIVGGFDERYYGYGYEDDAFWQQAKHASLKTDRIESPLLHLAHAVRGGDNRQRFMRQNKRFFGLANKQAQPNYLEPPTFAHNFFVVFVTCRCVRMCQHCAQQYMRRQWPEYDMSLNEFVDIVDCLCYGGKQNSILHISGGEPALWPNLREAIEYATERGMKIYLTTAEPDRIASDLLNKVHKLFVSVYKSSIINTDLDSLKLKVVRVDGTQFYPLPQEPVAKTYGGKCLCFHPSLCNGWVFRCSTGHNIGLQRGLKLEDMRGMAEPFGNYFWESAERRYDIGDYCTMCVSNRRVRDRTRAVLNVS